MKYAQKGQFVDGDGSFLVFPKGLRLFSVWIRLDVTTTRWYFRTSAWAQWLVNVLMDWYPLIASLSGFCHHTMTRDT